MREKTTDLTKGNVSSVILAFFFPMLFTNILQQIYNVVDTAIVGKGLGDAQLAAVGNMSSVTFLIFGFAMGLSNGFSVIIAQKFGAKEYPDLRRSIAATLELAGAIAVLLTTLSILFLPDILRVMQTNPAILKDSLRYGTVMFGGLIVTLSYNVCAGILRALGDSKTPFTAIIISSILNLSMDCLFIFVLKTGVEGAAIATVIAQVVSTLICVRSLRKIPFIRLRKEDFIHCQGFYKTLIANGLPMAVMNSITAVGCVVVQYFVNGMGVIYTSAYSVCSRFLNLFMQPACVAGFAMSSFTSQNYGAKEYKRILEGFKVCWMIAMVTFVVLGTLMVCIPGQLASIMISGEESIALVKEFLPRCGVFIFIVDSLFVIRSGVQGMGYPTIPMLSGIAEMILRISMIVVFVSSVGFVATAYAEIAAWTGAFVMNLASFLYHLYQVMKKEKSDGMYPQKTNTGYKEVLCCQEVHTS